MGTKVKDVKCFITAPDRANLVVVKVETTQPGLYGLGCATFTQRALAVRTAIEEYLKPIMMGRDVENIEDTWQILYGQSYWRNGPVLNNAISGIDEALWDIKGKQAGMPVYNLFGGKCREAVPVYLSIQGKSYEEVEERLQKKIEEGFSAFRVNALGSGLSESVTPELEEKKPEGAPKGNYVDPKALMDKTVEMMAYLREKFGYQIELTSDIHEKLHPAEAVELAKRLEPFRMFFIEDLLMPEQQEWYGRIRSLTSTPLAMGELYNNINEIMPMITERRIDYLRCHISQVGGLSPARKLAVLCEMFGVRTAWHGPGDLSPVGLNAQLHLDLSSNAFGIQEFGELSELRREMFPGCPELRKGYLYLNDKPGLGIDFNEELAEKYPPRPFKPEERQGRRPDGTVMRV